MCTMQLCACAGVSHSAIYEKADTSKPDVKAIDINQKVAGQSQERGTTPLLYCCTSDELQGEGSGLSFHPHTFVYRLHTAMQ